MNNKTLNPKHETKAETGFIAQVSDTTMMSNDSVAGSKKIFILQ